MIWAILIALGVPLWLCAIAILILVLRNRSLRQRYGDLPVRVLRPGTRRWVRGHALWVSDVFAWRASPAAWKEGLERVASVETLAPSEEERGKLRALDDPVIARLGLQEGSELLVAVSGIDRAQVRGPFGERSPASTSKPGVA